MSHVKSVALLVLFAAVTVFVAVADVQVRPPLAGLTFEVFGHGSSSCGKWTQAKNADAADRRSAGDRVAMASWVEGYVTATGMVGKMFAESKNDSVQPYAAMFVQKKTDPEALIHWIDQYCAGHPLTLLHEASQDLMVALQPN